MLDGLDECRLEERKAVLQIIRYLQQRIKLAVCLAERVDASLPTEDSAVAHTAHWDITLPENRPDIGQYIEDRLLSKLEARELSVGDTSIILEIRDALEHGSQGM